ncbi:MAG: hypothetical protein HFF96_09930 [Oscillibacter sp.]|uniref:hypothetical protein n=1 Tax=Oscillibacter sp. TaxID=1945593 RepID=UPI00216FCD50|nr:hypothetical protein [Oscillibacter sp.]MCI9114558.1 hypothetical protein [Oscillibacter sp.]
MRILNTGDPCPFCGQPIRTTDPAALRLLAAVADIAGFPDPKKEAPDDGNEIHGPRGGASE